MILPQETKVLGEQPIPVITSTQIPHYLNIHNCKYSLCALLGVPVVSEFDSLWPDISNKDTKSHSLQKDGNSNCAPSQCTPLRHKHSHIEKRISVQITISFSKLVLADSVFHFYASLSDISHTAKFHLE